MVVGHGLSFRTLGARASGPRVEGEEICSAMHGGSRHCCGICPGITKGIRHQESGYHAKPTLLTPPSQPGLGQVTFPPDFPLQTADARLRAGPDQQSQSRFHGSSFRGCAAVLHGHSHQVIVNIDIGPHSPFLLMGKYLIFFAFSRTTD